MTIAMAEERVSESVSSAHFNAETDEHDDGLLAFTEVRPRLFGAAYRMLGSAAEAEDIVQDVWLRWQATDRSVVENPPAFLATITSNESFPDIPEDAVGPLAETYYNHRNRCRKCNETGPAKEPDPFFF
jgi:Sigma-70 region 2